ncbi:PP2C family protein-serine/threonine phosphatase [Streptomyces sp. NPDC059506]|uniref:PP2C family protein-serine/threonine phosphatase n=1 Tax=Streptomyces sp. NPDC059506 TaxID=3347751 RepID=UPI00367C47C9
MSTAGDGGRGEAGLPLLGGIGETELDRLQAGLRRVGHLHGRLRQLLDAVLAVSGELELNAVLRTVVDAARELAGARHGALCVLDERGRPVELICSGAGSREFFAAGRLPCGGGLLRDLARAPEAPRTPDRADRADRAERMDRAEGHAPAASLLGVAIRVRENVYGNLYLADRPGGDAFSDTDEAVVTALAGAAGVAIENARLYQRLRQATEEFQRRLLPELPDLGPLQLQARYLPASVEPRIGGDWYDVIHPPGGAPCLVVGDVVGHDVHAATVMSRVSNMLRVIACEEEGPPSRILRRLDEVMGRLRQEAMVTALVARMEERGRGRWRLEWASAGHLPPLLLAPGGRARYLYGDDQGVPLGVDPGLPRTDQQEDVAGGSTLLMFTDGLVEDSRHSLEDGMDDFARAALALADSPLPGLCDALLAHRGGAFADDVALLGLRPGAGGG